MGRVRRGRGSCGSVSSGWNGNVVLEDKKASSAIPLGVDHWLQAKRSDIAATRSSFAALPRPRRTEGTHNSHRKGRGCVRGAAPHGSP